MPLSYNSFVAVGDSFTEGVGDPHPDGQERPRGWADLVARSAAKENPEFQYANLAIRGRLFDQVVDEQIPAAIRQSPDLVSFAAGANDAMRPSFNPTTIEARAHEVIRLLRASGSDVLMFTSPELKHNHLGMSFISKRFAAVNNTVTKVANRHGAILVNLRDDSTFEDKELWAEDRLHLSSRGHYYVASQVCKVLDIPFDDDSGNDIASIGPNTVVLNDLGKVAWARKHLAPWVKRRLTGKSSGDNLQAKYPTLGPVK